jgi:hypothetical protein
MPRRQIIAAAGRRAARASAVRRAAGPAALCREQGIALVMVLIVLTVLALIAAPFVVAMYLQELSSARFDGQVKSLKAAEAARNHALAHLRATATVREVEEEAESAGVLVETGAGRLRPSTAQELRKSTRTRAKARPRGNVIREDLGQSRRDRDRRGERIDDARRGAGYLFESQKGPSPSTYDAPDELSAPLPGGVEIPAAAPRLRSDEAAEAPSPPAAKAGASATATTAAPAGEPIAVSFADSRGISAGAEVADEQGKLHLDTAPPQTLGSLFGVGVLIEALEPKDSILVLEEASGFWSDGDASTIDGAVVLVDPRDGRVEAVTYRSRRANELRDCFRGAFFSIPSERAFPPGTFVYDLRGWKIGHHKFRGGAAAGYAPAELTAFATVEAVREIAGWPIAGLFLARWRGSGLSPEFLRQHGIAPQRLRDLGLDFALSDGAGGGRELEEELEAARRLLARQGISRTFANGLESARGARALIAFAAEVGSLSRAEARSRQERLEEALKKDRSIELQLDRAYVDACLDDLAAATRSPGIETIRPQDLEAIRHAVTVSSWIPSRWSEAQVCPDPLPSGAADAESFRIARSGEHGGGAIVRIRSRKSPDLVEFNQTVSREKNVPVNGFGLLLPLLHAYPENDAELRFLERHPVNVNSAPALVLRAVLTGVSGFERRYSRSGEEERRAGAASPGVVLPSEADRLAAAIVAARPLKGPRDLFDVLMRAAEAGTIDFDDVRALFVNSLQPNHHLLRVGTVGFCYRSADVYSIESRGILRDPAGGELARSTLREIVDVSPPGPLQWTLFTQWDFTSEIFIENPFTPAAPEDHHRHAVGIPGVRGHLVRSTPILYKTSSSLSIASGSGGISGGAPQGVLQFPIPGAERGTLRLECSETFANRFTHQEVQHFRDTFDGLELALGEAWEAPDFNLQGGARVVRSGAAGTAALDLSMLPGSVEAWVRFRTFPTAVDHEGLYLIADAGVEEERNRLSLLYDGSRSEWVARIHDSSLPDPSIAEGKQFFELRAQRPLDLDTWYHLRLAWDGAYSGGIQLFIDGLPVGRSNYAAELEGGMPPSGGTALAMRSADQRFPLPRRGVVRIGAELIEFDDGGVIRRQPESQFRKWLPQHLQEEQARQAARGASPLGQPNNNPNQVLTGAVAPPDPQTLLMRAPWNRRGSTPSSHAAGAGVHLHGYSLEIVHKLSLPQGGERQASGAELVWGRGGARCADRLLPWSFPASPDILGIVHFNAPPPASAAAAPGGRPGGRGGEGGRAAPAPAANPAAAASGGNVLAPVFAVRFRIGEASMALPNLPLQTQLQQVMARLGIQELIIFSPVFVWGGRNYNAADYFQKEGVLREMVSVNAGANLQLEERFVRYQKGGAAPNHPATQPTLPQDLAGAGGGPGAPPFNAAVLSNVLLEAQTEFLINLQGYSGSRLDAANFQHRQELFQVSLLADRPVDQVYPRLGILEVPGMPPAWHQPARPNYYGQDLMRFHPDDTVEWFRYDVVDGNLFVAISRDNTFRGYPVSTAALKNQMEHPVSAPIRLVMELADGGAGFGDFVTIATDDPDVGESRVFQVYRAVERSDGRFFVSLLDVDGGRANPLIYRGFDRSYSKSMNPRLVKFPTGRLPRVGGGRLVFFGDAVRGGGGQSGGAYPQDFEQEIETGFVIDELRLTSQASLFANSPDRHVRFALVPLVDGKVRIEPLGNGLEALGGSIPADRSISRSNPLEVMVVSVDRDVGSKQQTPPLFARGVERGLLRVHDELFLFENPDAGGDDGSAASAAAGAGAAASSGSGVLSGFSDNRRRQADPNAPAPAASPYDGYQGERDFDARLRPVDAGATSLSGRFEAEGFARVRDNSAELAPYFNEVFYYGRLAGGFSHCLRGQFQTPLVNGTNNSRVDNVTVRLRLIGRALLGTRAQIHGFGDTVSLVTCADATEIVGPLTDTGLPVADTRHFPPSGYLLIDAMRPGEPFEVIAYKGIRGRNLFERPRDESGKGILRQSFGSPMRPIGQGFIAHALPFRHFDRYEPEVESEDLACFQKSFRLPGASWKRISWRERRTKSGKERLADVVVAARFDDAADWSEKPANEGKGLYVFEGGESASRGDNPSFDLDVVADQLDLRIYFRYRPGCFQRAGAGSDFWRDDWKETPVLDSLTIEYEKAGRILRHEETDF